VSRTSPDIPGTWEHGDPGIPVAVTMQAGLEVYEMGGCQIFVIREPAGKNGRLLWHLSISRKNRHPSWDDIKAARYRLLPLDITVAVLLPPPDEYVNVPEQDHVFHVWEIEDERG